MDGWKFFANKSGLIEKMLKLRRRHHPAKHLAWLAPVVAVVLTLALGLLVFASMGKDPWQAFYAFFVAPIDDRYGLGEWLLKAAPLCLIALGLSLGFRANVWNIGAEGQLIVGAIAASGVALYIGNGWWVLPLMFLVGALAGMAWAAIPAFLRVRMNTNEILVSLMLVYVAGLLLSWVVHEPWRDPAGFGFPQSALFGDSARSPVIWAGTRLHLGVLLAPLALLLVSVFLRGHLLAYKMQVGGLAPRAARYAGFAEGSNVWVGLLAGGLAAGLAGAGEVAGPIGQLLDPVSPGYGFAAIIVAFLGRLQPAGIVLASLVMALLYIGGESAQIALEIPAAVSRVFQGGLLFFLLAAEVWVNYRLVWK